MSVCHLIQIGLDLQLRFCLGRVDALAGDGLCLLISRYSHADASLSLLLENAYSWL